MNVKDPAILAAENGMHTGSLGAMLTTTVMQVVARAVTMTPAVVVIMKRLAAPAVLVLVVVHIRRGPCITTIAEIVATMHQGTFALHLDVRPSSILAEKTPGAPAAALAVYLTVAMPVVMTRTATVHHRT